MRKPILLLALTAAVITACSRPTTDAAATGGAGAGAPAAEPGTPKYGGLLRASIGADPYDWDPLYRGRNGSVRGLPFGHASLLGFKNAADVPFGDIVLRPELAEKWEVSQDVKTFTFHLRRGAKFANLPPVNGREVTSTDVKFSYEYLGRIGEFKDANPKSSDVGDYLQGLDKVETPDPYTAVLSFKEANVPFLNYAALEYLVILPREVYDQEGNFQNTLIGAGPFMLEPAASQKGTRWAWKKNPDYFEPGKPYLDGLQILVLPDSNTAFSAFQAKQLDYINLGDDIPFNTAQQIKRANPDAVATEYEPSFSFVTYYNTRVAPLDDVHIRKAINLSIDPDEFTKTLQAGRGQWMMPAIPTGYFTQEEIKRLMKPDIEQAKKLLAEAGYTGQPIELSYEAEGSSEDLSRLELLQAQLKRSGINLVLKPVERSAQSRDRQAGKFTININTAGSTGTVRFDPEAAIARFHPNSPANYSGVNDPELTRLIEAQRREVDPNKRRELIRQAGLIMADKAYSHGLYSRIEYSFWQQPVKNLYRNANAGRLEATDIWLDR